MKMALDGIDRHVEDLRDLRQLQILLEPQGDNQPRRRFQLRHKATEHRGHQRIVAARKHWLIRHSTDDVFQPPGHPPDAIDAAPARDRAQPMSDVRCGLYPREVLVERHKDVLGRVFGLGTTVKNV